MEKIQRCEICDEPTGKCADDQLVLLDGKIVCEPCFDAEKESLLADAFLQQKIDNITDKHFIDNVKL